MLLYTSVFIHPFLSASANLAFSGHPGPSLACLVLSHGHAHYTIIALYKIVVNFLLAY